MTISDFIDASFDEAAKKIDWSLTTYRGDSSLKWEDYGSTISSGSDMYLRMSDEGYKDLARSLEKFLAPARRGGWIGRNDNC